MHYSPSDVLKTILLLALLVETFLFSLVPFALRHAARQRRRGHHYFVLAFDFLSCFGGGIFLGTCMLDLIPEAQDKLILGLKDINFSGPFRDFPLAEFCITLGFFVILIMEQIGVWTKEQKALRQPESEHASRSLLGNRIRRSSSTSTSAIEGVSNQPDPDFLHRHSHGNNPSQGSHIETAYGSINADDHQHSDGGIDDVEDLDSAHFDPSSHSTLRAALLVAALSLHSCFEGMALGVQDDKLQALQLFTALSIHKCIISFSLGMRLVQSKLSVPSVVICCLTFSAMSPIGGFVGIAISDTVRTIYTNLLNGILQAIAGGTFLYVTFFEILPHELNSGEQRLWKLVFVVFGFATICCFVMFLPS